MLWLVLQFILQMSDIIPVLINIITATFNYSSILSLTILLKLENNSMAFNMWQYFFFLFFFFMLRITFLEKSHHSAWII